MHLASCLGNHERTSTLCLLKIHILICACRGTQAAKPPKAPKAAPKAAAAARKPAAAGGKAGPSRPQKRALDTGGANTGLEPFADATGQRYVRYCSRHFITLTGLRDGQRLQCLQPLFVGQFDCAIKHHAYAGGAVQPIDVKCSSD